MFKEFMKNYVEDLNKSLTSLNHSDVEEVADLIYSKIKNGNKIFMIGNGGSSATPSHSAGDFTKELGAKVFCLSDNVPALTAWANDTDYKFIFKKQLEVLLEKDDLVIAYSGSGNSPNLVEALEYCKSINVSTVALTGNYLGKGGGKITKLSNKSIIFNTTSMERIEDQHLIFNHIIKEFIKQKIK